VSSRSAIRPSIVNWSVSVDAGGNIQAKLDSRTVALEYLEEVGALKVRRAGAREVHIDWAGLRVRSARGVAAPEDVRALLEYLEGSRRLARPDMLDAELDEALQACISAGWDGTTSLPAFLEPRLIRTSGA
jgi:hypothetical protein